MVQYQTCNWLQWKWMCHLKSPMAIHLPIEFSTKFIFCCFTCNQLGIELWSMSEWFEWWSAFWVHVQFLCNKMRVLHSMCRGFGYSIQMHVHVLSKSVNCNKHIGQTFNISRYITLSVIDIKYGTGNAKGGQFKREAKSKPKISVYLDAGSLLSAQQLKYETECKYKRPVTLWQNV